MKTMLFTALLLTELSAQPLPVIPMQLDPDQLAQSLRERKASMPEADCRALDLWECHPDYPQRVADISVRWVQLDHDPELEAVLITEAKAEHTYVAYVFDQNRTWNLVGSFRARQWTGDGQNLIRVQKLTEDSPPLLLWYRDLGGSGTTNFTTNGFQLRGGSLWPAFEVKNFEDVPWMSPYTERQRVLASANRLVIHTIREEPPGKRAQNKCEVRQWDAARHAFVPVPGEQMTYCDPKTGMPIAGRSFRTALPDYPYTPLSRTKKGPPQSTGAGLKGRSLN